MESKSSSLSPTDRGLTPPKVSGNLRELSRDPLRFFLTLTREYGDIVQYRTIPEPAYFINHPDYIKHVLQDNGRNYNKDTFLNSYILQSLTGQGLLTSENPLWRRQRRLIQPTFHQRNLATFAALMIEITNKTLQRWAPIARQGRAIDVASEMMRLTLEVVTQSLFGYDISQQMDVTGAAIETLVKIARPRHPRFKEAVRQMDEIVYGMIHKRRQQPTADGGDLLSMLLSARYEDTGEGMGDRQVRDEVMSLLTAGHETTANTLSWLWYLLSQHPHIRQRLEMELMTVLDGRPATVADFPRLTYTYMVIQEAMRLYPSAWSLSRRAIEDDEIGGYPVPAGAVIGMSPYTMHRHPAFWPDPETFDPIRFAPEHTANRPRFAYFPFGGGARQCIGNDFALMESIVIISMIMQHYRMHLVPDHPVETYAMVTLRPRYGILMTLEPIA